MNAALPPAAVPPVPPTWTTRSTEVFKTGTWRAALPRHIQAPSPCHRACPVGGDIAEWIGLARARDWRGAWQVLTRHTPFPAIAGRISHHPCESACNRGAYDEAVSICKLVRFVGDLALAEGWRFDPPALEREGRIAVIGGGPAGLSAAYQLAKKGHSVTIFDERPELGGMVASGRVVAPGPDPRLTGVIRPRRCSTRRPGPPWHTRRRVCAGHRGVKVACAPDSSSDRW